MSLTAVCVALVYIGYYCDYYADSYAQRTHLTVTRFGGSLPLNAGNYAGSGWQVNNSGVSATNKDWSIDHLVGYGNTGAYHSGSRLYTYYCDYYYINMSNTDNLASGCVYGASFTKYAPTSDHMNFAPGTSDPGKGIFVCARNCTGDVLGSYSRAAQITGSRPAFIVIILMDIRQFQQRKHISPVHMVVKVLVRMVDGHMALLSGSALAVWLINPNTKALVVLL